MRETPGKVRRFPFRLWLYAIVMTGAAGAAGWYAWKLRGDNDKSAHAAKVCADDAKLRSAQLDSAQHDLGDARSHAEGCAKDLGAATAHQKENDDQLSKMQSSLSATKDELTALRAQRVETEKRMAAIADIQQQFTKMIDTGQLKVTARRGSMVVELPDDVLFDPASAELSEKGQIAVIEVGVILKRFPDRRFLVVGHTDNSPLKSAKYSDNWELSTARALTVTRYLVKAGMKPETLVAAGVGEHDPLGADRARNRRIEIQLLPNLTELPPLPPGLGDTAAKTP